MGEGSSPLTRGKQISRKPPEIVIRLIPAHAGKTKKSVRVSTKNRAHPRSRGENPNVVLSVASQRGSSPLTRGKRACPGPHGSYGRLIPAHAGKTRGIPRL